jgi:hypothetical protein
MDLHPLQKNQKKVIFKCERLIILSTIILSVAEAVSRLHLNPLTSMIWYILLSLFYWFRTSSVAIAKVVLGYIYSWSF